MFSTGVKLRFRFRTLICAASATLLLAGPAAALNPAVPLEDYNHAMWTAKDGAPPDISAMAQTPDGWLWLATTTGLYRFDGVQFERYPLELPGLNMRNRIHELVARPNGDLWVSDILGALLIRHPDGRLENATPADPGVGAVRGLGFEQDGSIWAATGNGLFHYQGGRWQRQGPEQGWPGGFATTLLLDQEQRLWVAGPRGVLRYNRAARRFEPTGIGYQSGSLTQSPDGRVWVAKPDQVQLLPGADAQPGRPRPAYFNQSESRHAQFDRDGNLWSLHCPRGLCRTAPEQQRGRSVLVPQRDATDRFDQRWQMSSLMADVVLEDREGNVWIATTAGLERFRENRLVPAHLPDPTGWYTMARDTEGKVWAADSETGTAWQLAPGRPPRADPLKPVLVVANDRDGALLLAGRRTIERRYRGQTSSIALPPGHDGKPSDLQVLGLIDDGKVLWMASPQTGLMGYVDGQWLPRKRFTLPDRIFLSSAAGPGQLWSACAGDLMVFYDNGKQTRYNDGGIGLASMVHVGSEVLAGGDKGLALFDGKQFRKLSAADPQVLVNITGLVVTPDGDRWLNGSKGVLRVRKADWQRTVAQPQLPLAYQLINALDGYQSQAMLSNRHPSAFLAPDGQLWFMTTSDILRHDPAGVAGNRVAPSAEILRVNTAYGSYLAGTTVQLPAALPGFSIQFTAPSLRQPEGVRFAYQLDGVDSDWQDAGTRRAAFYTNVAPGSYRFRVKALNDDGVPSISETAITLEIAPTFRQTWWFKGLCLVAGLALLYALYRYRLHGATARLSERLQVRMAERERIARTLHDNFLQSVQAIILRLDTVARELPAGSPARRKLEALLDSANDTVTEGRDRVYELRSGPLDDVEGAIRAAGQALADHYPDTRFSIAAGGAPQALTGAVAEELCEIACEALRNAFQHARASQVEVRLGYGSDLFSLHVIDNGRGIAATAPADGEPLKHWGLTGMRERAVRAGGRLDIDSQPGLGTSVALILPARLAYAGRAGRSLLNLFSS
jgi:signal transduction histidine kinase/ligand-binding sensor domain-containing protein